MGKCSDNTAHLLGHTIFPRFDGIQKGLKEITVITCISDSSKLLQVPFSFSKYRSLAYILLCKYLLFKFSLPFSLPRTYKRLVQPYRSFLWLSRYSETFLRTFITRMHIQSLPRSRDATTIAENWSLTERCFSHLENGTWQVPSQLLQSANAVSRPQWVKLDFILFDTIDACMHAYACRLFGTKLLSEPMLIYLSIGPLETNFSETLMETKTFSFNEMHLEMSSAKFCLNVLTLVVMKLGHTGMRPIPWLLMPCPYVTRTSVGIALTKESFSSLRKDFNNLHHFRFKKW